jgi:hypothetical protein
MEIFTLDDQFLTTGMIEDYESAVWTDRFRDNGEFEIVMPWTERLATDLNQYKFLWMDESFAIMMIENAGIDREISSRLNKNMCKLSGRSLEAILEQRSLKQYLPVSDQTPIVRTGSRSAIAIDLFKERFLTASNPVWNVTGWTTSVPIFGDPSVTLNIQTDTLDRVVRTIIDPIKAGYRLERSLNPSDSGKPNKINFRVYQGTDWAAVGDSNPGIDVLTFAPELGNFTDISLFESIANYKNHAQVLGAKTVVSTYPDGVNPAISGLHRRSIVIEAPDIGADSTTTISEDQAALRERAKEFFAAQENSYRRVIEGEAVLDVQSFSDATLGSIYWLRDANGNRNKARIVEKVWTADKSGVKRLPAFETV